MRAAPAGASRPGAACRRRPGPDRLPLDDLARVREPGLGHDVELVDDRAVRARPARDRVGEPVAGEDGVRPSCAVGHRAAALAAEVVVADAAVHRVGATPALDGVVAGAPVERVVVDAAVEPVVTAVADQRARLAAAVDRVGQVVADEAQAVVGAGALDDLDVAGDVVALAVGAVVRDAVERHADVAVAADHLQLVLAGAADDRVRADRPALGPAARPLGSSSVSSPGPPSIRSSPARPTRRSLPPSP